MLFVFRSQTGSKTDEGQETVRNEMVNGRLQRLPGDLLYVAVCPGVPGQQLRALHL